jgi:hypothetical protein
MRISYAGRSSFVYAIHVARMRKAAGQTHISSLAGIEGGVESRVPTVYLFIEMPLLKLTFTNKNSPLLIVPLLEGWADSTC